MLKHSICSICGAAPVIARGWCESHYRRWKRHGDPLKGRTPQGEPLRWLHTHIGYTDNECLIWPYAKGGNGYPIIVIDGRHLVASRVMCEIIYGPPPNSAFEAAHSCGNGRGGCINPSHLRWKTPKDNCAEKTAHGTENTGERNGRSKLTRSEVDDIRALDGQMLQREIADKFNISFQHVSAIIRGKKWAYRSIIEC